jgi:hypothetical protein
MHKPYCMENDKSKNISENQNNENKRRKHKPNLFVDNKNPGVYSQGNVFNIPSDIFVSKRPIKSINVIKENPTRISQNVYNIMKDIHSNDPLTLYKLFNNLKSIRISEDLFIIIVRRCKEVLFRDIKNINPTGILYYSGDDVNIRNKATSNINIFSKIFSYVTNSCISESTILKGLDDIDIFKLVDLLKSEDETERGHISSVLINIFDVFRHKITNLVKNELGLFYEGLRTHIGIEEILEIVLCIVESFRSKNKREITDVKIFNLDKLKNNENDNFYFEYILRFLSVRNLEYYKIIPQIIYKYASEDVDISEFTLKYIYKLFQNIEYINKPMLIQIYSMIYIRWCRRIPFNNIKDDFCNIINLGLKSEHFVLIEEILQIIDIKAMKSIIQENITEILPRIFVNLYNLSKKYWRSKGKMKIFKYISVILSMSHECFEQCLIKYNMERFINRNEVHDSLIDVLGKCIEHSEMDNKKENEFNKRRKSMNKDPKKK